MSASKLAAIVPAAGESRRMGRPKLLLSIGGLPLLSKVIQALREGGADPVVVVCPPADRPESAPMAELVAIAGAVAVVPERQTIDMRESIEIGLAQLAPTFQGLLLCPGDTPAVSTELVQALARFHESEPSAILIPVGPDGRRGHPILLPSDLALEIPRLPPGVGVNALIAREPGRVRLVPVENPRVADDLDTPDDYRSWQSLD